MNRQTDMPTDDDFYIDESAFFDPVFVPWRSFKAFLTVYDIGIGGYQPGYMEGTQALSRNVTGDKVRASLLKHGLIEARDDGKEIWIKYLKGIPFGRHTEGAAGTELWVCPDSGSAQGSAWLKSEGRCHYCGEPLRFFSSLAFHPDDGRFACKSCHGTKGTRTLDEWRFIESMKKFEAAHGVRFDRKQVEFLAQNGVDLGLEPHRFHFERFGYQPALARTKRDENGKA